MAFVTTDSNIDSIRTGRKTYSLSDLQTCEVLPLPGNRFQVLVNHKVYILELDQVDADFRKFRFYSEHETIEVELIRPLDQLIQKMGLNHTLQTWVDELKAPMPGLVKKIMVNPKDEVIAGQNLIILEAMKMENVIKAPQSGKIKFIGISENQTVEKGQLLIKFES